MGVTGLWKLIDQSGKEVLIETLENKVLAIDISIWLHQVIKGFQDRRGNALQNAHLLGLFNRLCKLLYYRIKPVFIFDGSVPALKRDTIGKRQQGRTKRLKEVERIQELLLEAMAKEKIVQKALDPNVDDTSKSPNKLKGKHTNENDEDGVFIIPEYLSTAKANCTASSSSDFNTSLSETDSLDDSCHHHSYDMDLQNIDVTSREFKNLPPDVRLEILADLKEMRKQHSWGRLHEMPKKIDNFSEFQMKRLLKRRQVQVSLEETKNEVQGISLTLSELESFLTDQGIVTAEKKANRRINSDPDYRFLYIKDLKGAIQKAKEKEATEKELLEKEMLQKELLEKELLEKELVAKADVENDEKKKELNNDILKKNGEKNFILKEASFEELDDEDNQDIQLAIEQSLSKKKTLSKEQFDLFKKATGSARDYLLKYGIIKNLDVEDMDDSQIDNDDSISYKFKYNKSLMVELIEENSKNSIENFKENKVKLNNENIDNIAIISDDSDSDVDFVAVSDSLIDAPITNLLKTEKIQVHIDPTKPILPEEDIFADVFSEKDENISSKNTENSIQENDSFVKINIKPGLQNNMTNILKDLEQEAIDIVKLSLDDIPIKNSEVEVPDSQETLSICNLNNELTDESAIIVIKDSQENLINKNGKQNMNELSDIEIPDSQDKSQENQISINCEKVSKSSSPLFTVDNCAAASENNKMGNQSIIEILDSEEPLIKQEEIKSNDNSVEIIEICEESNNQLQKTPSKQKIVNFFEKQYVVKKTPSKDNEEVEFVPKVISPFFVKKSPGSSNKKNKSKIDETKEKISAKVSKTLFESNKQENREDDVNDFKAITDASKTLRNNKSEKELKNMVTELNKEKFELEKERNRQDRMGLTITEKMTQDCMDLLKYFGVPYIVAPMEAEAQCAFLENIQLTDGTITDDSDIWLFGGQTVYKNFFDKQKHVLEFRSDQIERDFSLDREKLIQLAFLVGSDYTIGIKGIGTVTALEILAAFPNTPAVENETTKVMSILSSLRKFRDWYKNSKNLGSDVVKVKLKSKLKNIEIFEGFPNLAIADAYLYPTVDDSKEPFTWGTPDLETIRKFTKKCFGWTQMKTDETLGPILRKLEQKKSQTSIKSFFTIKSTVHKKDLILSKRVEKAVKKMSNNYNSEEDNKKDELKEKLKKPAKRNTKKKVSSDKLSNCNEASVKNINEKKTRRGQKRKPKTETNDLLQVSRLPSANYESPEKKPKLGESDLIKKPCIPQTKQVIPQRELDIDEMNKRKELASKLFKRTRAAEKIKMQ